MGLCIATAGCAPLYPYAKLSCSQKFGWISDLAIIVILSTVATLAFLARKQVNVGPFSALSCIPHPVSGLMIGTSALLLALDSVILIDGLRARKRDENPRIEEPLEIKKAVPTYIALKNQAVEIVQQDPEVSFNSQVGQKTALSLVFKDLDPVTLTKCSLVCKRWWQTIFIKEPIRSQFIYRTCLNKAENLIPYFEGMGSHESLKAEYQKAKDKKCFKFDKNEIIQTPKALYEFTCSIEQYFGEGEVQTKYELLDTNTKDQFICLFHQLKIKNFERAHSLVGSIGRSRHYYYQKALRLHPF